MVPRRTAAGSELRVDTTASVTGSSGRGVLAPPLDLEVTRRRTRSRPEPARPGARPGGTLVLAPRSARPTHAIDDGRRGFGRTPGRTRVAAPPRSEPGRPRGSARARAG
jgi:hypothetical protein